jgi:16S rRNA (guanine527-N7)-methyltransferase
MSNERNGEFPPCENVLSGGLLQLCRGDARVNDIISPRFDEVVTQLAAYIEQIELYNPAWGLVGTNDRQELVVRHILDSLAPLGIISRFLDDCGKVTGTARVADVGSGAGLPGIPLAIALPGVQFSLIERGGRRANFLRIAQTALNLAEGNLGPVGSRCRVTNIAVEEAEMEKVKSGRFNVVTFRAFRPLEPKIFKKLIRLCAPGGGATKGGVLAAYKGRREKAVAEMTALENALPVIAGRWEILPCPVPLLDEERHLVLIDSND